MALSQQDYQVTLECLKKQHKEITASKEAARQYLMDIGVLDAQGNEVVPYLRTSTPQVQE